MDTALEYIVRLWPVAVGFIGIVAWLVRVDGRTMQNAQALQRIEKENSDEMGRLERRIDSRRKEDMERIDKSLSTIAQDIKTLLGRDVK